MNTDVLDTAVLKTEIRLFGREPGSVFWILLFPTLLLAIMGSVPSFREADPDLGGLRPVDAYVPVAVLLGLIVGGLQGMPPTIAGYRENGILRRMSTTPVRPAALLTAQMLVLGAGALLSALAALAVGRLAFDVTLPRQPLGYLPGTAARPVRLPGPGGPALRPGPHDQDRHRDRVDRALPRDVLRGCVAAGGGHAGRTGRHRRLDPVRCRRAGPETTPRRATGRAGPTSVSWRSGRFCSRRRPRAGSAGNDHMERTRGCGRQ